MSLAKIPFIFLIGWGAHVTWGPAKEIVPQKQQIILTMSFVRLAYWVHAAIELAIILAAAVPKSTVADTVLTFLLPGKDPSRIFLSPMSVLATALTVIGAGIRSLAYQEMGKHFTFHVTILKDHKLITSGPYSYVRHPGYAGACLSIVGLAVWHTVQGSWLRENEDHKMLSAWFFLASIGVVSLMPPISMFLRMHVEDELLKKTFGKEWDEWARKVPARFIPGIY